MTLTIISCVRNEAPFLLEWIAHHRALGVGRFLIYSNDCDDGTDAMLDALQNAGILTHVRHERIGNKSLQWQAFNEATSQGRLTGSDWITALDCDEFLNPLGSGDLAAILAQAGDVDAIAIPWRLFGNSSIIDFTDQPICEQFTRAAPVPCHYPVAASFFKTIYRAAGPFQSPGIHRPKQTDTPVMLGPDLRPLPDVIAQNQSRIQTYGLEFPQALIQLNHYSLRSAASFMVKRDRGLPNRAERLVGLEYWVERNFNTCEDTSIKRHSPAAQQEVARLRQLPGVQDQHDKGCAWHRARFEELMTVPENAQFFGKLILARDSVDPGPTQARELIGYFQAAQRAGRRDG